VCVCVFSVSMCACVCVRVCVSLSLCRVCTAYTGKHTRTINTNTLTQHIHHLCSTHSVLLPSMCVCVCVCVCAQTHTSMIKHCPNYFQMLSNYGLHSRHSLCFRRDCKIRPHKTLQTYLPFVLQLIHTIVPSAQYK